MAEIDDLEQQIKKTVVTNLRAVERKTIPPPTPKPALTQSQMSSVLEACQKAAEIVRNVHANHEAEGESLAKHLEQIGGTFLKMCQESAKQVRDLRIMPKEMAEKTAEELLSLGQQEEERHDKVTKGLISARDALLGIQGQYLEKDSEK